MKSWTAGIPGNDGRDWMAPDGFIDLDNLCPDQRPSSDADAATIAKAPQEPLNTKNGSVGYSTQCAAVTAPDDTEMPAASLK